MAIPVLLSYQSPPTIECSSLSYSFVNVLLLMPLLPTSKCNVLLNVSLPPIHTLPPFLVVLFQFCVFLSSLVFSAFPGRRFPLTSFLNTPDVSMPTLDVLLSSCVCARMSYFTPCVLRFPMSYSPYSPGCPFLFVFRTFICPNFLYPTYFPTPYFPASYCLSVVLF